jgi:hypothetical protein
VKEKMNEQESQPKDSQSKMQEMAGKAVQHYRQPMPMAELPEFMPFSPRVVRALLLGVFLGDLLGLLLGLALRANLITLRGWEALYSMTPFTFYVFWGTVGTAAGIFFAAIFTYFTVPSERVEK